MIDFREYPLFLSLLFLLSLFHLHFASSSLTPKTTVQQHRCLDDQRSALVQLHHDLLNSSTSSRVELWDLQTDCCSWAGVACDTVGHVIGLDLSYLSGHFASIFRLNHLLQLNLAGNFLESIPSGFDKLGNLTHLNLSGSSFTGKILSEISHLTKLQSLDLSNTHDCENSLIIEIPNMKKFVKNLTSLTQLYLDEVYLSAQADNWCEALTNALPNLRALSLVDCGLLGPVCSSISELPFLSELHLDRNKLSSLPPNFLANSSHLTSLTLNLCELQGTFPQHVFLLPQLRNIDISSNPLLTGQFPEFPFTSVIQSLGISDSNFNGKLPESIGNLKFLTNLKLENCNFSGVIPPSIANLTNIVYLALRNNNFSGSIPSSIANLTNIMEIDFRYNSFSGGIPPFHGEVAPYLAKLDLSNNQLHGIVKASLFTLPSLKNLDLRDNQLAGELNNFSNASFLLLESLELGHNNLTGIVPKSVFQLSRLTYLRLDANNFVQIEDIPNATFPEQPLQGIENTSFLTDVDLSSNKIKGPIPNWIWNVNLLFVNLSHNYIDAFVQIPTNVSLPYLQILDLHANKLQGSLPKEFCNFRKLTLFDASYNNISGPIPDCLGNHTDLIYLDLQRNNFQGRLPDFGGATSLRSIKLNGNNLDGKLPRSFSNCTMLEILDIGDNLIHDTFPFWLHELPALVVLVFWGNKLHGPIDHLAAFPMLHVLDLSHNEFTGELPKDFLQTLVAMQTAGNNESTAKYVGDDSMLYAYYKESVVIMNKGLEVNLVKILKIFASVDLSNNRFNGEIPQEIGNLKSLIVLNLSGNNFIGHIPLSLGNLRELESLDLSQNQLSGEIPQRLTGLTFLAVMNLSYNQLEGSIPRGNQFDTFSNASYKGNSRLCGSPLTRKCGEVHDSVAQPVEDDEDSLFDWKIVLIGYGCGLVIGFSIGYTILDRMGHKWFASLRRQKRKQRRKFIQRRGIQRRS